MSQATITEVATLAGVSMKSVSRVINQEPHVSAKLRLKVELAITQLGYKPNMAARSLAAARTFTIVALFDNPSPAYIMKVLQGAFETCRLANHRLVFEHINTKGDVEQGMRLLLQRSLDGIILTPPTADCSAVLDALDEQSVPYVRLAPSHQLDRSHSVSIADHAAAAEIAGHLWQLGHRSFGLVNGPALHGQATTRRSGFLTALAQLGTSDIVEATGDFSFVSGMQAGDEILSGSKRPTAIFAANDDMAAGVYASAAKLGLTIGRDLSIVGFDDSWIAQSVWPPLTTVYQPIAEMADAAAKLLTARPASPDNCALTIAHRLITRGSTSAATPQR